MTSRGSLPCHDVVGGSTVLHDSIRAEKRYVYRIARRDISAHQQNEIVARMEAALSRFDAQ